MINQEFSKTAERILQAAIAGLAKWTNDHLSIDDYLDQDVDPELRPPVSSMLFEYFRNKAMIDRIVFSKCARVPKPRYQRLLLMTLTQCLFQTGIRAESAVNIAVDIAREKYSKSASGFINGVLRAILRDDLKAYQKEIDENPLLRFPRILQKRWKQSFNVEELREMSEALAQEAPLVFRLTGELSEEELDSIKAVKLPEFEWAPNMIFYSTDQHKELFKQDFLTTGRIYIQDPATSLSPCMAEIKGGEKILDMCAAPGGKALILAERLKGSGELVAADRSAKRQELTRENFENRDLKCNIIVGGANELRFPAESFDIILLDVPCSNTGVFRHKADALWRFTKANLDNILKIQTEILEKAAEFVVPGGQIVYSTCSIEYDENQSQIEKFLEENKNFKLLKQKLLLPNSLHDGVFSAIIVKK